MLWWSTMKCENGGRIRRFSCGSGSFPISCCPSGTFFSSHKGTSLWVQCRCGYPPSLWHFWWNLLSKVYFIKLSKESVIGSCILICWDHISARYVWFTTLISQVVSSTFGYFHHFTEPRMYPQVPYGFFNHVRGYEVSGFTMCFLMGLDPWSALFGLNLKA